MTTVSFIINSIITTIEAPDNELYLKLIGDNYFATYYIKELVRNGFIDCGKLEKIVRINYDTSREIIYDLTEANDSDLTVTECESPIEPTKEDSNEGSTIKSSNREVHWNVPATKFLLDKYETYLNMVGPLKKFKTKKNMWKKIAAEIKEIFGLTYSELQCENRFKTIKKRKNKAVINNNTSGSSRMTIEYEEEFKKIAAIDDSMEPEILRGVGKCSFKESVIIKQPITDATSSSTCNNENIPTKNYTETIPVEENTNCDVPTTSKSTPRENEDTTPRKKKCIRDVLLEIHYLKEEQRERRHNEKMELLKMLIDSMKK